MNSAHAFLIRGLAQRLHNTLEKIVEAKQAREVLDELEKDVESSRLYVKDFYREVRAFSEKWMICPHCGYVKFFEKDDEMVGAKCYYHPTELVHIELFVNEHGNIRPNAEQELK